jgi:hypothetical protein
MYEGVSQNNSEILIIAIIIISMVIILSIIGLMNTEISALKKISIKSSIVKRIGVMIGKYSKNLITDFL